MRMDVDQALPGDQGDDHGGSGNRGRGKGRGRGGGNTNGGAKRKRGPQILQANKKFNAERAKLMTRTQLTTRTHTAMTKPRGADFPPGLGQNINRTKACLLVIRDESDILQATQLVHGWKCQFDMDSQRPALKLTKDNWEVRITHANFQPPQAGTFSEIKNWRGAELVEAELQNIAQFFADVGAMLIEDNTRDIIAFGTNRQRPDLSGLKSVTFRVVGNLQSKWIGEENVREEMSAPVRELLALFSGNQMSFTFLRCSLVIIEELDDYWLRIVEQVVAFGVWPFYAPELLNHVGHQFQRWLDNPKRPLSIPPWMINPTSKDEQYVSFPARTQFSSIAEWEISLGSSIIHDQAFQTKCIEKYFSGEVQHEGLVTRMAGKYVEMEVVFRVVEGYPLPRMESEAKLWLYPGEVISEQAVQDITAAIASLPAGNPSRATVLAQPFLPNAQQGDEIMQDQQAVAQLQAEQDPGRELQKAIRHLNTETAARFQCIVKAIAPTSPSSSVSLSTILRNSKYSEWAGR